MSKNEIAVVKQSGLVNPGDNMSARITDTGRQVIKVEKNRGKDTRQAERDKLKNTILRKYNLPIIRFKTNASSERELLIDALNGALKSV